MFKVPVLLVLYNRIEETHKVFQILRAVQPTDLYVAGDGPKPDNTIDRLHVYQTRSVIQPDWPCQVHNLWQEDHLGKTKMIDTAIRWFFSQEEEGIILFNDILPSYDFFPYCEELLSKYRNNEQVYSIGGTYLRHHSRKRYRKRLAKGGSSYFFSAYGTTWGFATWRNRMNDFTLSMDSYNYEDFAQIVDPYMKKNKNRSYWIRQFTSIKKNNAYYWDYQYNLHIWAHKGICITPYLNLTTNIGFRQKSHQRKLRRLKRNAYPIMPLTHPDECTQNTSEDKYMFRHVFRRAYLRLFRDWLKEILPNKNNLE